MFAEQIAADCREYDDYTVNIVVSGDDSIPRAFDTINCVGGFKTTMNMVWNIGIKKAYIFNIPRHVRASTRDEAIRAIAYIKKGFLWRCRGGFKDKLFDPPQVWVFVTDMPSDTVLKKRWKYWRICPDTLKLEIIDWH